MRLGMGAMGLAAALVLGGCSTVDISSPGSLRGIDVKGASNRGDRTIQLANEGYFLFQRFPIVCGDLTWTGKAVDGGIAIFSNQLSGDIMMGALSHYANSQNCDLTDIVIRNKCECPIGLFGILDWFNTVVGYQAVSCSGVLCPRQ